MTYTHDCYLDDSNSTAQTSLNNNWTGSYKNTYKWHSLQGHDLPWKLNSSHMMGYGHLWNHEKATEPNAS